MMTPLGWTFMSFFWAFIIGMTVWCFRLVLASPQPLPPSGGPQSAGPKDVPPPAAAGRPDPAA